MMGITIGLNNKIRIGIIMWIVSPMYNNYDDFVNLRLNMKNSSIQYTNI